MHQRKRNGNSATKPQTLKREMKRFSLRGNSANWDALKVEALNTETEERVNRSEIPYGHKIVVRVVNNFYRVYDKNVRQILHGEISEKDNAELVARLTRTHRPHFILYHNGVVVGVANYHRRNWFRKMQEEPKEYELEVTLKTRVKVLAKSYEEAEQSVYDATELVNEVESETCSPYEIVGINRVQ